MNYDHPNNEPPTVYKSGKCSCLNPGKWKPYSIFLLLLLGDIETGMASMLHAPFDTQN